MADVSPIHREEMVCARCGLPTEPADLDRNLWCEECRGMIRSRAKAYGWGVGAAGVAALALWILFAVTPSDRFLAAWALILAAAFWLLSKIGRELVFGIYRWRYGPRKRPGAGGA